METLSAVLVGAGCFGWLQYKRQKMQRLVLREANKDIALAKIEIEEVETPKPKSGQLLIKVLAAPVNPSDDGAWKLPLGIEGSGRVVATGGGLWASQFLGLEAYRGDTVAFTGKSYAQYAVVDAFGLGPFILPSNTAVEDACSYFVNPFTVVSIVEAVRSRKGKAFIHTAAASQLGQMMVKYCQQEGMVLVNVVRRKEQVEVLEKLGAKYIVDTSDPEWKPALGKLASAGSMLLDGSGKLIHELQISQVVDCIAGNFTGELLAMLPPGGTAWVYGRLSGENLGSINPIQLIYFNKKLEGFLVNNWIFRDGIIRGLLRGRKQAAIVGRHFDVFGSRFKDVSMLDLHQAYCSHLAAGATGGKVRLRPWMES
ncbi:MECR [Symbiodinium natans]|uniref:MECR protein n=1 Tax=Symbiodinium natans TaxID=878477 RepID=A0A812QG25_9DINO|nr:MECR [Symbiodinium natans]